MRATKLGPVAAPARPGELHVGWPFTLADGTDVVVTVDLDLVRRITAVAIHRERPSRTAAA